MPHNLAPHHISPTNGIPTIPGAPGGGSSIPQKPKTPPQPTPAIVNLLQTTPLTSAFSQAFWNLILRLAPAGIIVAYDRSLNGGNLPEGFVLCQGQTLSDGSKIQDLRGNFIRGFDAGAGNDSGRALGTFQSDRIRNITGNSSSWLRWNAWNVLAGGSVGFGAMTLNNQNQNDTGIGSDIGANAGQGTLYFDASKIVPTGADNAPKNVALEYIVKLPASAIPSTEVNAIAKFFSFARKTEREEITVHGYAPSDKSYTGSYTYDKYPFESLPANSTAIEPNINAHQEGSALIFDLEKQLWKQIEDHRGKTLYSEKDASPLTVEKLGALPKGYTETKPPPLIQQGEKIIWTGSAWETLPPTPQQLAKNNLSSYFATTHEAIALGKKPTATAVTWANEQMRIASSEDHSQVESLSASLFASSPPRPDGPLSLHNSNWFMQT